MSPIIKKITFLFTLFYLVSIVPLWAQKKGCKNRISFSFDSIPQLNYSTKNNWTLVFEDDFNDSCLDKSKWIDKYPWGRNLVLNPEKQYYTPSGNMKFSDSKIYLIGKEESIAARVKDELEDSSLLEDGKINYRSFPYTSAMIFSKETFLYGKFEIRCKIPTIKGVWPAFWLFGQNPCYEEIDVFEFMDDKNSILDMTIHGQPECKNGIERCNFEIQGKNYAKGFHTYSVEWDELKILFSVDGKVRRAYYHYYTLKGKPVKSVSDLHTYPIRYMKSQLYPYHPMHVIANLAIKNSSGGFPSEFAIDYVRVYRKE
jgi:beta-glucanase (GH16 family)